MPRSQVSGDVRNLLSTGLGNNYIGEIVMSYTFRQSNENEVMALTKMSEAAFNSDKEFGGDDGANVRSDSWQVAWKENCIEAVISGEEQSDIRYILYFDGKTDSVQLDTPTGEWK